MNSLPCLSWLFVADQSSGKSSLLEAISGVPFPRKDKLCIRQLSNASSLAEVVAQSFLLLRLKFKSSARLKSVPMYVIYKLKSVL